MQFLKISQYSTITLDFLYAVQNNYMNLPANCQQVSSSVADFMAKKRSHGQPNRARYKDLYFCILYYKVPFLKSRNEIEITSLKLLDSEKILEL